MKEDKNRSAYQKDLESGILDNYKGKYVAYKDGSIIMDGVEILAKKSEKKLIRELQDYQGHFYVQKVMATKKKL